MVATRRQIKDNLLNSHTGINKKADNLREIVEKKLKSTGTNLSEMLDDEIKHLLHDLEVHQIELEMQNDELCKTQGLLEASNAKYANLYDLAPVGYFTCDSNGHILEANLTMTKQLGIARESLLDTGFYDYIVEEDKDEFYLYLKKIFRKKTGRPVKSG